ncbi:MAG: RNA methyltransferase [Candidatus Thorarchaeota archaeon]
MGLAVPKVDIVLVRPKKADNIGSVARLIVNFDFDTLILVGPQVSIDDERARVTARHAKDVLDNAVIVENLLDAVKDSNLIIGTTARTGGDYNLKRVAIPPENLKLPNHLERIALVFGPEDNGLNNDEINSCDLIITLPAAEEWPVLNLSHAAAILMYFISQQVLEIEDTKHRPSLPVEREILLKEFSQLVQNSGFQKAKQAIQAFKNIMGRGYVTGRETHTLIGAMKAIQEPKKENEDPLD